MFGTDYWIIRESASLKLIDNEEKIKMRKKSIKQIISICVLAIVSVVVLVPKQEIEAALDYYTSHEYVWADGIQYEIAYSSDGFTAVEIVGYNKNEISSDVVIPDKVPGTDYKVNYIGNYAFECNKTMKTLTIEGSQDIAPNAFMACSNLEKVTFNQVSNYAFDIDGGAFSGCSSLKEFVVNDPVEEFDYYTGRLVVINGGLYCYTNAKDYKYELIYYPEARIGNTFTLEPKSAYYSWMNGNLLAGNRNITTIVSDDTEHYQVRDGVLFSSDMKKLYCYPAGKTDTTYTIPEGVTEIAEGAFYNAANLRKLYIPNSVTQISATRATLPWYFSLGALETSSQCTIDAPDGVVGANGAGADVDVCYKMCQPNYDLMIYCDSNSVVYDVAKAMSEWAGTNEYGLNINDVYHLRKTTNKSETLELKQQTITTAKVKAYKAKTLKKKKVSFNLEAKTSGNGKLTYKVIEGKSKYITVNQFGKVTLKKGCIKGTYKIKITATKTSKFKMATKVVVVKIK